MHTSHTVMIFTLMRPKSTQVKVLTNKFVTLQPLHPLDAHKICFLALSTVDIMFMHKDAHLHVDKHVTVLKKGSLTLN